jgi:hypothetical protein
LVNSDSFGVEPVPDGGIERTAFPLGEGQSWAIGRGDGCAVMLDSRSVSRLHALIQRRDAGDLALVDLGSRNGSFVNGTRVSFPVALNDKDKLLFGDQPTDLPQPRALRIRAGGLRRGPQERAHHALHTNSLTTILVVDIRDFTPLARRHVLRNLKSPGCPRSVPVDGGRNPSSTAGRPSSRGSPRE